MLPVNFMKKKSAVVFANGRRIITIAVIAVVVIACIIVAIVVF